MPILQYVKPIISALPRLTPTQVVNTRTGELLSWDEFKEESLASLLEWVHEETSRLYSEDREGVHEAARGLKFNSAEHARQAGFVADHMSLPRGIKAKSRLSRLVGYQLMSETAAYERNLNPLKQPHAFSRTINLGAVDHQMAHLERNENLLILTWKCWLAEYELTFLIPHYAQSRNVTKWSLPLVSSRGFIFTMQESPTQTQGNKTAGVDLGRVEPFTLAILSHGGLLEAEYRARPQVRATNAKRERILQEVTLTRAKASAYTSLGLDEAHLREQVRLKRNKASRIASALSGQIAADIVTKITRHDVSILHIENLKWAAGAKYGSKWTHGATGEKIEHSAARAGVRVKRVSARNTSQMCHACRAPITHQTATRTVRCSDCKSLLDRDVNAAMNIAKNQGAYVPLAGISGNAVGVNPGVPAIRSSVLVVTSDIGRPYGLPSLQ